MNLGMFIPGTTETRRGYKPTTNQEAEIRGIAACRYNIARWSKTFVGYFKGMYVEGG